MHECTVGMQLQSPEGILPETVHFTTTRVERIAIGSAWTSREVFVSSPFGDVYQEWSQRAICEVQHFSGDGRVQAWAAVRVSHLCKQ